VKCLVDLRIVQGNARFVPTTYYHPDENCMSTDNIEFDPVGFVYMN